MGDLTSDFLDKFSEPSMEQKIVEDKPSMEHVEVPTEQPKKADFFAKGEIVEYYSKSKKRWVRVEAHCTQRLHSSDDPQETWLVVKTNTSALGLRVSAAQVRPTLIQGELCEFYSS